ncbi:hypothetical protein VTO73DRAFT_1446 [Trametes versicolor]
MTPLFAKFIHPRSSSRSTSRSERRTSMDSFDSTSSYVISIELPSIRSTRRTWFSPSFSSATSSSASDSAEMMDDENLAWGRPARKHRSKFGLGWGRA